MSTEAESHKEQFELDELFRADESIKPFKIDEIFEPDELNEFYGLRDQLEQDESLEQDGPFKPFKPDGTIVEIELDKLIPFGKHSFELFQGRLLDEMIDQISVIDKEMDADGNIVATNVTGIRILVPIIVHPISEDHYEILDGHYRVAAARKLKEKMNLNSVKIPAVVKTELTDEEALSFVDEINPIGLLINYGIDITSPDYRQTEGYKRIANDLIRVDEFSLMTVDEYIEHFLLDEDKIYYYDSVYSMGNPYILTEEECTDEAVACEIVRTSDPEREDLMEKWRKSKDPHDKVAYRNAKKERENDIKELVHLFNRDGGYIQQLKEHLQVDLDSFDNREIKNCQDRAKILFFIYTLRKEFPNVKSLQTLGKPSMENIDNSFLGWKTYNGDYIKYVQHEIEMEISPQLKTNVKKAVSLVVNDWGNYMIWFDKINSFLSFYAGIDCSKSIDSMITQIQELFTYQEPANFTIQPPTPLESLYLNFIKNLYRGQMYDLLRIHDVLDGREYSVPAGYMEAMRRFEKNKMGPNDIEEYFSSENIREKAKYIYLKEKVTAEERRRIKVSKVKVLRFLEFFNLADPFGEYGMLDDVTELLIISCLQSILLDKQNEIFDYKFYRFEGKKGDRKGVIRVQAALKNDAHTYDALRVYWVRRVMDRSYANVGDSEMRKITSRFEKMCIEILIKILNCSTISEMLAMSNFYAEKLEEQFAVMQIAKVSVELSHSMGIAQYKTATRLTEKATTRGQYNID